MKKNLKNYRYVLFFLVFSLIVSCTPAYAYLSRVISTGSKTLETACFFTDISVYDVNNTPVDVEISEDGITSIATLEPDIKYQIILSPSAKSTAKTGFVYLTADICSNIFFTPQFKGSEDQDPENTDVTSFKFSLKVEKKTQVSFISHLGRAENYTKFLMASSEEESSPQLLIDNTEYTLTATGTSLSETPAPVTTTAPPVATPTSEPSASPTALPAETSAPTGSPLPAEVSPTVSPESTPLPSDSLEVQPTAAPIETGEPTPQPTSAPLPTEVPTDHPEETQSPDIPIDSPVAPDITLPTIEAPETEETS